MKPTMILLALLLAGCNEPVVTTPPKQQSNTGVLVISPGDSYWRVRVMEIEMNGVKYMLAESAQGGVALCPVPNPTEAK